MKFAAVDRAFLTSPPAALADNAAIGTWMRLLSYCWSDGVESATLTGARRWEDRAWIVRAQVITSEVEHAVSSKLAFWVGDDLFVEGFGFDDYSKQPPRLDYGSDWWKIRQTIVARDGWQCVNCSSDDALEVHHRRPLRTFNGNTKAANADENLVTLCRPCHREEDARIRREGLE